MSADQVDSYLRDLEEPKRTTLQELRRTIIEIVPGAEEGISYGIPAFRLQGQVIAGFAAFKSHLSYLPFSGSVLGQLADELEVMREPRVLCISPSTEPCRRGWSSN